MSPLWMMIGLVAASVALARESVSQDYSLAKWRASGGAFDTFGDDWATRVRPGRYPEPVWKLSTSPRGSRDWTIASDGIHQVFKTGPTAYRAELTHSDHPRPEHRHYRLYASRGVEYCDAIPITVEGEVNPRWHIITQFWQANMGDKKTSPPITLHISHGYLRFRWQRGAINLGRLELGREYRIVLNYVWQKDQSGWMKLYLDEEPRLHLKGKINYHDRWAPYLKVGIYHRHEPPTRSVTKIRRAGFGRFAGKGCLPFALAHVQRRREVTRLKNAITAAAAASCAVTTAGQIAGKAGSKYFCGPNETRAVTTKTSASHPPMREPALLR